MGNDVKLFEGNRIRSIWNNEKEEWYFSIIDVVNVLTDSKNSRRYWSDLKRKMKEEEGADQLYENIVQLKLKAPDGKMRETDVADMQGLFRIIQSIPSPKAEPFKMWLAEVGKERVDETINPELTIDRALETYLKKGYTREWINQRLQAIQVRKELTDSWQDHGVTDGKRLWNCIISRGKTKEIFNSDNKSMFDELLDSISNAFEYWRYIYEKDDGFIDINFLRFFRLLLREICCEQLYDKTWKEYIE